MCIFSLGRLWGGVFLLQSTYCFLLLSTYCIFSRKTPGGVFFALVKKSASKKDLSVIFRNEREKHRFRKMQRRHLVRRAKGQGRGDGAEWDGNEGGGVTEGAKVTPGKRPSVFSRLGAVNVGGSGVEDTSRRGNGTASEGGASGVAMETHEAESALFGRGCLGVCKSPGRGEEGGEGGEGELMEVEEGEMVDAVSLTEAEVLLGGSADVSRTAVSRSGLASQDLNEEEEEGRHESVEERVRETDCIAGDFIETECQAAAQEFDTVGNIHFTSFTLPD